jgi:hypothetical protein
LGTTGLISNLDEAREFAKHPIKPFDAKYTRDFDTWNAYFNDFKRFIIGELKDIITILGEPEGTDEEVSSSTSGDLEARQMVSELYSMWYGTLKKIRQYDLASGQSLYPTNCGRYEPFTRF